MHIYEVTVRDAVGRELVVRIQASNMQSASNQAILRAQRETGRDGWMVALCLEAV